MRKFLFIYSYWRFASFLFRIRRFAAATTTFILSFWCFLSDFFSHAILVGYITFYVILSSSLLVSSKLIGVWRDNWLSALILRRTDLFLNNSIGSTFASIIKINNRILPHKLILLKLVRLVKWCCTRIIRRRLHLLKPLINIG